MMDHLHRMNLIELFQDFTDLFGPLNKFVLYEKCNLHSTFFIYFKNTYE